MTDNEPVHLVEDETGDRFLVYGTDKGLRLDIRYEGETLWMTQAQIAQLFGVDRSVVTKHLANVYADGELEAEATSAKIAQVRQEGPRKVERQIDHYNLDVVILVGYRVSFGQTTVFRRWATGILVQLSRKGFVVDAASLKKPDNIDRVAVLRAIIREIRSDEARVYRELRRICALCQDYDGTTEAAHEFYQQTQAKLVNAVTSRIPSELVAERANHKCEKMGLRTRHDENTELNRLTTMLLDIFEGHLDMGQLLAMQDAQSLLDRQLDQLGQRILNPSGSEKTSDTKCIAETKHGKQRKKELHRGADRHIDASTKKAKNLRGEVNDSWVDLVDSPGHGHQKYRDDVGIPQMKTKKIAKPEFLSLEDSILFEGDALTVLQRLPSNSVQCAVTSPPYWGLRDYDIPDQIGLEPTLPQFINRLRTVFAELRRVLREDGIFWLNIGDGYTSGNRGWRAPDKKNPARAMDVRPETPEGLKPKDLLGIPWRLAFALQEDGWYLRADIVWNKPNAMPESVKDRPTRAHEYIFMFTKGERYFYDRKAILELNGRNRRSVWNVHTQGFSGAHFATFPPKLVEPCIKASTRPGDFVLDPFSGAGTAGVVSEALDRRYVGIELNPKYVEIASNRDGLEDLKIVRIAA